MANVDCYHCGEFGHVIADCPELRVPSSKAEHEYRLKAYQQRFQNWLDGSPGVKWNPEVKARAIEHENRLEEQRKHKEMAK